VAATSGPHFIGGEYRATRESASQPGVSVDPIESHAKAASADADGVRSQSGFIGQFQGGW
jgi:hypothetical protein